MLYSQNGSLGSWRGLSADLKCGGIWGVGHWEKSRGSWAKHSILRAGQAGSPHLQVGASLSEKVDRQRAALGLQMCIEM